MSSLKKEMMRVHENTDFKVNFAGITEMGEFRYTHGGSVKPGLEYHIHYTNNKKEVYMTGGVHNINSKIIEKVGEDKTIFSTYSELKPQPKQQYPRKVKPLPSKSDYRIGTYKRYFAQKGNNLDGELFEISKDDFDVNNLFRYMSINWRVSGTKREVFTSNSLEVLSASRIKGNEQLLQILSPLQYWNPPKGSSDDIREKLSRRKIM
jgi:hypothetical protein|tara:strand:- start:15 stop:635 length:621 start_codon:yes stop_codon:yes gene_type:complete